MKHEIVKEPLDAEVADMLKRWKDSGIGDIFDGDDPEAMRERGRKVRALFYPKPDLPKGSSEDFVIAGPGGDIPVSLVLPQQGQAHGAIVYLHGGGWIVGDRDSHEMHAVRIANNCGLAVLNVDYRLAPEHIFPAAIDDTMAALRWMAASLDRFGGAHAPLAVGGDSAGGNLAAAAAWMARDEGIKLKAQLLLYAATNLGGEREDQPGARYLGPEFRECRLDPRASPARANLKGVATAIVGVGPHDFLYQDNLAFVEALEAAGVETIVRLFPSLGHSYFSYTGVSKVCVAASNLLCDDLKAVMRR